MNIHALTITKVVPGKAGDKVVSEFFTDRKFAIKTAREFVNALSKRTIFPLKDTGYSVTPPKRIEHSFILPVLKPQKSGENIVVLYYAVEIFPVSVQERAYTSKEIVKMLA